MPSKSTLSFFGLLLITAFLPFQSTAHELNPKVIYKLTGETITHDHSTEENSAADPRDESRTFYSFPEWYIVYSAQEYGDFVTNGNRPSQFPYFASIGQQWDSWSQAETLASSPPDGTTKTVLWTISISFIIEYGIAGLYENTLGRVSEWLHFGHKTVEDRYIDAQAVAYGEFLNQVPWYEFPYLSTLGGLWQTWSWSSFTPRGIERRVAYTIGYGTKAIYAGLIKAVSGATFEGGAGNITQATVSTEDSQLSELDLPYVKDAETNRYTVSFPRYRAFKDPAVLLVQAGGTFVTIQGHDTIALSVIADTQTSCIVLLETTGYTQEILTKPTLSRYVLSVATEELTQTIQSILACEYPIEHIYDY